MKITKWTKLVDQCYKRKYRLNVLYNYFILIMFCRNNKNKSIYQYKISIKDHPLRILLQIVKIFHSSFQLESKITINIL